MADTVQAISKVTFTTIRDTVQDMCRKFRLTPINIYTSGLRSNSATKHVVVGVQAANFPLLDWKTTEEVSPIKDYLQEVFASRHVDFNDLWEPGENEDNFRPFYTRHNRFLDFLRNTKIGTVWSEGPTNLYEKLKADFPQHFNYIRGSRRRIGHHQLSKNFLHELFGNTGVLRDQRPRLIWHLVTYVYLNPSTPRNSSD